MRFTRLLSVLCALSAVAGCRRGSRSSSSANADVAGYLMPAGKTRVELMMERRKTGHGQRPIRQPRRLVAVRTDTGVVYRIRERVNQNEWRTAAQLFFDAKPGGAWLARQFNLYGKRVGPRSPRLMFPWPARVDAKPRALSYRIFGRRRDGGKRVKATVRVLRTGFHETVAGKRYGPCLEVREDLTPDVGGSLSLRTVFCRGLGRFRIEQRNESLSRGRSVVVDQVVGVRSMK